VAKLRNKMQRFANLKCSHWQIQTEVCLAKSFGRGWHRSSYLLQFAALVDAKQALCYLSYTPIWLSVP
jgi:hypothetical protein